MSINPISRVREYSFSSWTISCDKIRSIDWSLYDVHKDLSKGLLYQWPIACPHWIRSGKRRFRLPSHSRTWPTFFFILGEWWQCTRDESLAAGAAEKKTLLAFFRCARVSYHPHKICKNGSANRCTQNSWIFCSCCLSYHSLFLFINSGRIFLLARETCTRHRKSCEKYYVRQTRNVIFHPVSDLKNCTAKSIDAMSVHYD